jgi:hypothetical protein
MGEPLTDASGLDTPPDQEQTGCPVPGQPVSTLESLAAARSCAIDAKGCQRKDLQALWIDGVTAVFAETIAPLFALLERLANCFNPGLSLLAHGQSELPFVNGRVALSWSIVCFLLQPAVQLLEFLQYLLQLIFQPLAHLVMHGNSNPLLAAILGACRGIRQPCVAVIWHLMQEGLQVLCCWGFAFESLI